MKELLKAVWGFTKRHYKDIAAIVLLAFIMWQGYTYVKGWIDFRKAQIVNAMVIQAYFKNDNPELFNKIIAALNNTGNQARSDNATQKPPNSSGVQSPEQANP